MSDREVGAVVLAAAGVIILALVAWARRGRTARARRWMYSPLGELRTERMVILGAPTCGLGLLALGAAAVPSKAFGFALIDSRVEAAFTLASLVLLALLVVPLLYWLLIFIPMPDWFYPPWAREVRRDRRRYPQTSPSPPDLASGRRTGF